MTQFFEDRPPGRDPGAHAKGPSIGAHIRNWFLAGVVVAGPLAITVYIVWWFVDTVDGWVKKLVPASFWPDTYLPFPLPGLGVIVAFLGLTLLGFLAANLAGRSLIALGEAILGRMPIIRSIYKSVKQVFETLFSQSGTSFRKVGLIEFPVKGTWTLVFISVTPADAVAAKLPPARNPMSRSFCPARPIRRPDFISSCRRARVIEVALSPDEAVKLIVSCGVIHPEALPVAGGAGRAS